MPEQKSKPMLEAVTQVTAGVVEQVNALLEQLNPDHPLLTLEDCRQLVSSKASHLFFLKTEGETVGMVTVVVYRIPMGLKSWIEDVVIDSRYRGRGWGRWMLEQAIAFARAEGVDSVMLTSRPQRVAANALYRSLGFQQRETNVYKLTVDRRDAGINVLRIETVDK